MLAIEDYKTETQMIQALEARRAMKQEIKEKGIAYLTEIKQEVSKLHEAFSTATVSDIEDIGIDERYFDEHLDDVIGKLKAYVATVYLEPYADGEEIPGDLSEIVDNLHDYIKGVVGMREAYSAVWKAKDALDNVEV